MFSFITNTYNKKTKGPTLMELFTATGKLIFLTTRDVQCVHHWWHGTHRYDMQVLATHTRVNIGVFCLHRHPFSVNCLYHARMVLSVGDFFAYFARNAHCTVTIDLFVWYSYTQNDFSSGRAIFSVHTLASPSGRNVNYGEKQVNGKKKIRLFLLSVQVS